MEQTFKVGEIVETFFDTGALGVAILYGRIIAPTGPKQATVEWESGLRNRIAQSDRRGIKHARQPELARFR